MQAACVEMCSSLYPGKPLEVPGMIMRGAYGHIKHHRQAYHGAASLVDAAMSRTDSEFGGCPVLGRICEGVMSMLGQQTAVATSHAVRRPCLSGLGGGGHRLRHRLPAARLAAIGQPELHADFETDAAGVAMLASSYFWGYTLMQIPAGLLVDRYGVKRVVLLSMVASSLGSAAFALAPNLLDVFAARLVVACGDALVFTALLKLVAQSFSDERFGVMSGISQVSGYVGGVIATTPLAAAVTGFGWRACFLFIACVGLVNLVFAKLALKPDPVSHSNKTLQKRSSRPPGNRCPTSPTGAAP